MKIIYKGDKTSLCQAETVEDYVAILKNFHFSWDKFWKHQSADKIKYLTEGKMYFPNKFVKKMGWK